MLCKIRRKCRNYAPVISIKNPKSGTIIVPAVGEITRDDYRSKGVIEF